MRVRFATMLGLSAIGAAAWSGACGGTVVESGGTGAAGTGGATSGTIPGTTGGPACTPGTLQRCTCAGGFSGTQTCVASGASFGACVCGQPDPVTGAGGGSSGVGTGGSTSAVTSTSTGSGGPGGGAITASPPPPGPAHPANGMGTTVFAVTKFSFGDVDPNGTPDEANGWKYYGYNIDDVSPSKVSAFCQPVDNANPSSVHQEGFGGIENSFGHNILPMLLGITSDFSVKANQAIASGDYTTLILLSDLGKGENYNPILAGVGEAGALGSQPKFDGTDVWPIVGGSKVSFQSSYLVNDTWVSGGLAWGQQGADGPLVLPIQIAGTTLTLTILLPRVTMRLNSAHTRADGGVISGVLRTSDLQAQIQAIAGQFDPSLCSGPTIQSILQQVASASDIMHDGTQDPTKACDAISIGLGFEAVAEQVGATVAAPPPPPNPCQ